MTQVTLTATFTTAGAFTWTAPAGVSTVTVACTAGGGGGGAVAANSGDNGGGGGGGEAALEPSLAVTGGLTYSGTVGAAGAGGTSGGAGAAGGLTSFAGDSVTVTANPGQGGSSGTPTGAGQHGAGGTGSTNLVSAAGGNGDDGTPAGNGGGGGGAAGVSLALAFPGNAASGSTAGGASGGTWPGGAGGAGGSSGSTAGSAGSAPGGGGGGAISAGLARAGGAGAGGQVVITWTQTDPVTLAANTAGGAYTFTAPAGASAVTAQAWGAGASGLASAAASGAKGLVGSSMPTQCFKSGCYDEGLSQEQGDAVFVGVVSRGTAGTSGGFLTVTKKFWNPSDFHTNAGFNNLANYQAHGTKVKLAVKPGFTSTAVNGGTPYTGGPHGGNGSSADLTALAAFMSTIAGMGFTSQTAEIVLWQEPANGSNNMSATDFGLMLKSYGPAVNASSAADGKPFPLVVNVNYVGGTSVSNATDYANAALGLRGFGATGATIAGFAMDYYTNSYWDLKHSQIKLLLDSTDGNGDSISGIADTAGVPFGLNECGAPPKQYGGSPGNPDPNGIVTAYFHYITDFMTARLAAGKTNLDMVWYDSQCPADGTGDISSPIGQDPTTGALVGTSPVNTYSDFRVALYQAMFDALAAGGTTAAGGAGGGGGEFAQESSLAITGGTPYSLVVGAAAAGSSGGNTTVAGQSVTVTAHGGSVATVTTAGGAGGTGSANSTAFSGGAGGAGGGAGGGGGGGGGSAGTAAGGNAGNAGHPASGGAGGTAVTGGGRGGGGSGPGVAGGAGSGPGGGGGGGGSGAVTGGGADGQITLSSFTVHPGGSAAVALAPLGFSGTGFVGSVSGSYALAPLGLAATVAQTSFTHQQDGAKASGTGSCTLALTPTATLPLITAKLVTNSQVAFTAPAGWKLASAQNCGGSAGRAEIWYYPAYPGGAISAVFTGSGDCRGYLSEFAVPAGYAAAPDGTAGTTSGTSGTSFPVSTPGSADGADLLEALFLDEFSVATIGQSWTTPSNWTLEQSTSTGIRDNFAGYWRTKQASGAQSVTGTFSTTTNQTGYAAIVVAFIAVPLVTSTASVALAPLALAATGNSVVPPLNIATSGGLALAPLAFQSPSRASAFPADPLPLRVEILVNGVWADITGYVYQRAGIAVTGYGRPDESSQAQPAQCAITLNNRDGSFSPANTAGQFYPYLTRNTQLRVSVVNAVTPQGAWYSGYRFSGEVPGWPPGWDVTGSDVYVSITAAGVLQRLRQSKSLGSPLAMYYQNLYNVYVIQAAGQGVVGSGVPALVPAGYWPAEDATGAASFASGIAGGSTMTWTGTPGLAADSNVAGSAPFAQLNGSAWTGTPGAFSQGGVTFTTPGTFSWTCPAGVTSVLAECWGAGGGGSSGIFSAGGGSGGGGGEYAAEPLLQVTPGKSYTVVVGAGGPGGAGSFSSNRGTAGASSTFKGDSVTVHASGGAGGPASSSHGIGGSGSTNTTHHNGGNGGNGGAAFGGSGGGSSGGNGSAGNNGSTSSTTAGASGGSAPIDGGPGGTGGLGATAAQGNIGTPGLMPVPGPGGGGGGGGYQSSDNYGKPGGGGAAGQVSISFGAQAAAPQANVLRAVIDVPSGGGTDGATLLQALTSGTVASLSVIYHTGGNLQLKGKNGGGTTLFDSGSQAFSANGQPLLVSAELVQNTTSTIHWKLTAITPNATAVVATYTGSISGTLGSVTSVKTNAAAPAETTATGVGHISMQYAVDPILNLAPAFAAYAGELAAARFVRLCATQNIPVLLVGNAGDTPQMGEQPADLLINLLQECETADLGLMFEPRSQFGLGYRTRVSLQNQSPGVVLDYSEADLAPPLAPTGDELLVRNDITITRTTGTTTGTSFEAILPSGPLSAADPPNGVGTYAATGSVNLGSDTQLQQYTAWLLTLGTVDEFRYPQITVNLARSQVSDGNFYAVAALGVGDFIQVVNPPSWLPQGPISQLCYGFTETLNAFEWTISINAVPEDPYTGTSLPAW